MIRLLLILALALCGCKPPAPPAPAPAAPLIVSVGGLGWSQLGAFNGQIAVNFPAVTLANFGPFNGYLGDVAGYTNAYPHRTGVIFAAHSFGCQTVCESSAVVGDVALIILYDPVCSTPGQVDLTVPPNVRRCLVFRRSKIGVERMAVMHGVYEEIIVPNAGHNDVPSSAMALDISMAAIAAAL